MTIKEAAAQCENTGYSGWELVEYAQKLVGRVMKYSYTNSLDTPELAFEKGRGYCWHQASALHMILNRLGFDSRLVHAFKNRIPERELDGVKLPPIVSGHVWCRITIDGEEKDVCSGDARNTPGAVHFKPLTKIREWNKAIEFFTYYGAPMINARRYKKFLKQKEKQERKWNAGLCPCRKKSCARYKDCARCKEYHYAKSGLPKCER